MGFNSKINQRAEEILSNKRLEALHNQDRTKSIVYSKFPRLQQIEQQLVVIGSETAKAVLNGVSAKEMIKKLAEKSLELQNEAKYILTSNGYSEDALEPHYSCERCNDTGRYDDETGRTVLCDCLKKIRIDVACDELNKTSPLELSSFDNFRLDYYDTAVENGATTSPYERMSKVFAYCKKYAKDFSLNSPSIIMRGATGLGKTHLSLAIANQVIQSGFGVIYVSAPMLLSQLEKSHFKYDYDTEEETINSLVNCDLLIIDDLGTEFQSNYATSTIYNIFNSRLLNRKPTIMNTNLTLKELESSYSPRFVSRVMGNCSKIDFLGRDIRRPRQDKQ